MSEIKVYAYDFFDTVVHRDCHPEKVLFQWTKQVSLFLDFIISPSELYQMRKGIERNLKQSNSVEELTYMQLLKTIYNKLPKVNLTFIEFFDYCYELELEIELSHLFLDKSCTQEIREHSNHGDNVIIVSDFYLGKDFILSILEKLEFNGFFEEIFVSSDLNKRKSTGNLYRYILEFLKIQPHEMLMQGDNYKSDVQIPKQIGINVNYRKFENPHYVVSDKSLKREINRILFTNAKEKALSGYAGEIVYFISKLYKSLCHGGYKKALFCSREGQLLKKLFDMYQIETWGKLRIESLYFYISRKAAILPSLDEFEHEKFDMIFRQFKKLKLKDFLKSIGFSDIEIKSVCKDINTSLESEISVNQNNETYIKLKQNLNFLNMYDKKRTTQKILFYDYLHELGYSLNEEKIAIVDIGWKGTIQDCIQRSLPNNCIVDGYYLGLRSLEFGCINSEFKHGLLFTDYPEKCKNYSIFEHNYMFYERIFVADHGPVLGYDLKNGKIIPIIDNNKEELIIYDYMKPFQDNLIVAFDKILKLFSQSQWEAYERYDLMIRNLLWKQCVYFPKIWKIEKDARSKTRENFGDISKNEYKKKEKFGSEQMKKADFLFVDYSFRFLEKCHLNCLSILAEIYCRLVYLIKRIRVK